MKVEFWGAAQTVTGSMHLVHWRGKRLLLDCGLYQGSRKEAFEINRHIPFSAQSLHGVILSHAHIDHSGNLPSLIKAGYRGRIYATRPTRDLAAIMLLDSAKIQESDVDYVNRQRRRQKQTPFEPLYRAQDAEQTSRQFRAIDFGVDFHPVPFVTARFHEAGHMLGAATIELELEREDGNIVRLVFSGDIGRPNMPILKDPKTVAHANYLIMEATYGDRLHPKEQDVRQMLLDMTRETIATQGKMIIPAFSVGRTQEIVYHLNALHESGELGPIPVFVDSPLAVDATQIFRQNQQYFDEESARAVLDDEDKDLLYFKDLYYIRKPEYSKKLNTFKKPCIIISASGMCESGRVLHHLKNHIGKPNTIVLFVGYQAPNTLGRRLLDGSKRVRIYGDEYEVAAKIRRLEGTSGHADQQELLKWAMDTAYHGHLRKLALVHCEKAAAEVFANLLRDNHIQPVIIPARGEVMSLTE